jgi:hypothetical protein
MPLPVDRSLRLPDSEYFAEPQAKSGIALHHTVCDSARTTMKLWRRDQTPGGSPKKIATAYVVERDGTVYEAFDPECWAWQFGLSWRDHLRIPFEKRFIGIEISSEGGLMEYRDHLYAFEKVSPLTRKLKEEALECDTPYRGYQWFDRYETAQLASVARLVDELCARFAIPRVYPEKPFLYYGNALASFEGVIGHAMVRADKSDPAPDPRLWQTLRDVAGLTPVPGSPSRMATRAATPLTERRLDLLAFFNASVLADMDVAAGSLVKTLLKELERRDVYLRLDDAGPDGHVVKYTVVQGDAGEVARLGQALGFKTVSDRFLEVRRG